MRQYVIYESPKDFPGQYVVRGWKIEPGRCIADTEPIYVGLSVTAARGAIRDTPGGHNLSPIPRFREDEPHVLEVWL